MDLAERAFKAALPRRIRGFYASRTPAALTAVEAIGGKSCRVVVVFTGGDTVSARLRESLIGSMNSRGRGRYCSGLLKNKQGRCSFVLGYIDLLI